MAESKKMPKKFYRSSTDKQLAGVCGGIAEYFNWDSTLVRLGALILILVTGFFPGLIVYIVAAAIAPVK